jgi:hypothetical protein
MKPTNEREQIEREIQEQEQKSREHIHCAVNPERHFD